ncbi:hypothetical protein CDES_07780 [Corynebacterium deserti GIMN1.010]|uniref:HIRAN domain-containing protein n=1 Tax=Corynebacterium deserti GIMN1.010 TaxID=931089 RepID=A0A0M5IM21_9CORY|nr:hypothetical protein [Corynebacterium deserti]ALC05961.1 hypothetical protein CDES_07780 [Corynebacterium deserti GIMN1.010]
MGTFGPDYPLWGVSKTFIKGRASNLQPYYANLRKVINALPIGPDEGVYFDAELVPERDNPESPFSISLRWNGLTLGYMSTRDSVDLFPEISRVASSGFTPTTPARLWGSPAQDRFRLEFSKPKAGSAVPLNAPPSEPFVLMPNGAALQVQGEEKHLDFLIPYVPPSGSGRVLLTLVKPEGSEAYEVLLDNHVVGSLTAATSKKLAEPFDLFTERGLVIGVRGKIAGNDLDCQLTVNVARANEFTQEDLQTAPTSMPELKPFSPEGYPLPVVWGEEEPDWSLMVWPDGTVVEDSSAVVSDSGDDVVEERFENVEPVIVEPVRQVDPQPIPEPIAQPEPQPVQEPKYQQSAQWQQQDHAHASFVHPQQGTRSPTVSKGNGVKPVAKWKPILAWVGIVVGAMTLLGAFASGNALEILGGIFISLSFLGPGAWWVYNHSKDKKALEAHAEAVRKHEELHGLLQVTDPALAESMGSPEPVKLQPRRWPLVAAAAVISFFLGGLLLPAADEVPSDSEVQTSQ